MIKTKINPHAAYVKVSVTDKAERFQKAGWDFQGVEIKPEKNLFVCIDGNAPELRVLWGWLDEKPFMETKGTPEVLERICATIDGGAYSSDWTLNKNGRFCKFFI